MPLTNYLTLGRSGLRVSPFCLGTMTFGEDWGWGSTGRRVGGDPRAASSSAAATSSTPPTATPKATPRRSSATTSRATGRRDRAVIATKFFTNLYPGDPNGGGAGRKTIVDVVRAVAAPAQDRLHRSVLDALLGSKSRRSTRRCGRWTIWCAPAKCATSASRTRRRGRLRRRSCWRSSAAGRRSSDCRSSIR